MFFCFLSILSSSSTHAQITLDGSLGPKGALTGPNYTIDADVGKQVGGNLFHSFGEFNVNTGESATFTGPDTVDNVIGRVTGGNFSFIAGPLRSSIPEANLYLVNPSGVLFGPNASLDVDGSFHVSTADYLRLGGNGRFDATTPSDSLLTSAPPEAFGFLGPNAAPIFAVGTAKSHLQVPAGETLSIIGGNIQMTGANLQTQGGQMNVVSVASPGEVVQHALGQPGGIDVSSFSRLGQIDLTQETTLIDSGEGGGSIVIRNGQLAVKNSSILSATQGNVDGKDVDIRVKETLTNKGGLIGAVTRSGGRGGNLIIETEKVTVSEDGKFVIGSGSSLRNVGTGNSGNLIVHATDSITASEKGGFISSTFGSGNAGDIKITTPKFTLDSDGIVANTTYGAGNAGKVEIETGQLSLSQGSSISSVTSSSGRGGDVTIKASDSVFLSGRSNSKSKSLTLLASATTSTGDAGQLQIITPTFHMDGGQVVTATSGSGHAGDIRINTRQTLLTEGAIINSGTDASGKGGNISLTATDSITFAGSNPGGLPNVISSVANRRSSGDAGNIFLVTPTLNMSQGRIQTGTSFNTTGRGGNIEIQADNIALKGTGQQQALFIDRSEISSSTLGTGQGGTIKITARESFVVNGSDSGLFSETGGSGTGGAVDLQAKNVQLTDGAKISAQSDGTGDAGNLFITATDTFRSENSTVTTEAASENGGNITLRAGSLAHLSDSQITATVTGGQGKGGNITIEPTLVVLNHSTISANAFGGPGGNVSIASDVFLASPDSEVTASSTLGVDGVVDIQSPITNVSGSFAPLPESFVSTAELLPVRCAARLRDGQASSFVVRGRDALPPTPDGMLPSPILRRDQTNTVAPNAASVGWDKAGLFQVEADCLP